MSKRKYLLVGIIVIAIVFSTAGSFGSNLTVNKNLVNNNISHPVFKGAELEVTTDKTVYKLGDPVTIFLTNVGDELLCAGGPIVTIYNEEDEIVYQDACYCYWELNHGEYITWPSWDQTDKQGNQVPVGEYVVEGFLTGDDEDYVDTVTFFIIDYDPSGSPSGPLEGVINVEYIFCIKLPDDTECEPYYLMWDWGDGFTSEWLGPYVAGEIVCVGHFWISPGAYDIRVKIRDGCDNEYWTDPLTVNIITNSPPASPYIEGPKNGKVGISYDYTFMSTDPEDTIIWYYIEWGDDSNTGWLGLYQSGQEVVFSHIWNEQATFTIKAKTKDIHGAESDLTEFEIKISNPRTRTYWFSFIDMFPILQRMLDFIK